MGCHSPLCPICQNIRLIKEIAISHGVLDKVLANGEYEGIYWYHLVLTEETCGTHQLVSTTQQLRQGFNRLIKMAEVDRVILGASAYLHVKLKDAYGQIKPHLHVLVAMKPSFKGKRFISMSKLTLLWQEALGIGYLPYVNIIALPLADGYPARQDFVNLIAYSSICIQMKNIREYPETYLDYTDQAWGLRKVRHIGLMAEMRRAVKADYQTRIEQAKANAGDSTADDAIAVVVDTADDADAVMP